MLAVAFNPLGIIILFLSASISQSQTGVISESLKILMSNKASHDVILELPSVIRLVQRHPTLAPFSENDPDPKKTDIFAELLKKFTKVSQAPFLKFLDLLEASDKVTRSWISNKIAIRNASTGLISALSLMPGPFTIREQITVAVKPIDLQVENPNAPVDPTEIQWGVKRIGAPHYWDVKGKGKDIVVANIDSGVNLEHEALQGRYRGGQGSWLDVVKNNNTGPYDDYGHGTHSMGAICGTSRGIGVAPEAKWIACKALDGQGLGTEPLLTACAQWLVRPNGQALLRPNIVSNSWGASSNNPWFDDEIAAWQFVGIIPIFAVGNSGSNCQTASSPGDRDRVISVGSTGQDDTVMAFSSRGSTMARRFKPEVVAPGDKILSAWNTEVRSYATISGSSTAASNVAGAVALLMQGKKASNFSHLRGMLKHTALKPVEKVNKQELQCGTHHSRTFPNNAWGYGRIRVSAVSG